MSNIRTLLVATATANKCSVSEASTILQSEVVNEAKKYAEDSATFEVACDAVIAEKPTVSKGDLPTFAAMHLANGDMTVFANLLEEVREFVNLTYDGKRGRRKDGDLSVRLTKK